MIYNCLVEFDELVQQNNNQEYLKSALHTFIERIKKNDLICRQTINDFISRYYIGNTLLKGF